MSIGTLAFFGFALFVLHEFEEIIRVYLWIKRHSSDQKYKMDLWISRKKNYPSTECISFMIGEEILLISIIMTIGILFNSISIVLAVVIFNTIHLLLHLLSAIGIRKWNPGSITSIITIILNAILLIVAFPQGIDIYELIIWTIITIIILMVNIQVLYKLADKIQKKYFSETTNEQKVSAID